ncbi:MAG: hypothetical protein EA376_09885 [Phycisphaeraceae bacterium]|nr:MAG: hypothetical protein EA376_09885 [Phycisphaeraceae bacterium]
MPRSRIDTSLARSELEDFAFPLGVYPVEEFAPRQGYTMEFEAADGDDEEGEWEEWPDRYVFDVAITATRLESLCRSLFSLMPGRVYPILDVLGHDAYREVDPYIAYDLVGFDRFMEAVRRHRGWFYEDGLVGFGAMSLDPFIYVFVDEHKIVTVRVETNLRDSVEKILAAFDLESVEELRSVDAAVHEHRGALLAPENRPDLMVAEEIIEELVEDWRLRLNIDRSSNTDDLGRELGVTGWRCLVRIDEENQAPPRYAEAILTAGSLDEAEQLVIQAVETAQAAGDTEDATESNAEAADTTVDLDDDEFDLFGPNLTLVTVERVTPEEYRRLLATESGEEDDLSPALAPSTPGEAAGDSAEGPLEMGGAHVDVFRWLAG